MSCSVDPAERSHRHLTRSAGLVAALLAADKLLGVVREAAVGQAFGASPALDAYFAAFEIPEGLNAIVTGAALTTALIPLLTEVIAQAGEASDDANDVWRFVSTVVNWVSIVIGVAAIFAAIFARSIIVAVAPGFADDPTLVTLATHLMRLVLIQTIIFSVSTVITGTLQAHQHFFLPALAPVCYTLGRIFGVVMLAPRWGIFGLAWGGLTGAVAHLLIKLPWLLHRRATWVPTLYHPRLPRLLRLMLPRMMGMTVTYITFVLPTFFGSQLPSGAISAYEYAWKLMQLPETVLGTAVGIVALPTLAEMATRKDQAALRRTFAWTLRLILALSLPAAVGLVVLGRPLTTLVLQRGAFDAAATDRVYWALQFLALGLVTHSALEVAARLFYAQQDMWTPFWVALGGLLLNASVGNWLLPSLAHGAIALANSLGAGFQVLCLLLIARYKLGGIEGRKLATSLLQAGFASAVMAVAVMGAQSIWLSGGVTTRGIGGAAIGALVYTSVAVLVGSPELRSLPGLLRSRLPRQ